MNKIKISKLRFMYNAKSNIKSPNVINVLSAMKLLKENTLSLMKKVKNLKFIHNAKNFI